MQLACAYQIYCNVSENASLRQITGKLEHLLHAVSFKCSSEVNGSAQSIASVAILMYGLYFVYINTQRIIDLLFL